MNKKLVPNEIDELKMLLEEIKSALPAESECHKIPQECFESRLAIAQQKVAAGTHRLVRVRYELNFSRQDGRPWQGDLDDLVVDEVRDENGERIIEGFSLWKLPKAKRPLCGARCRDGHLCAARVVVRADGSFARRCRLHGGLSTGAKSTAGRQAIAESNRRRAGEKRQRKAKTCLR